MAFNILDLPKEILNYIPLDPKDTSHFRATCKTIYKGVNDTAKEYRECATVDDMLYMACKYGHLKLVKWGALNRNINFNIFMFGACVGGHLEIAKWCASEGATDFNWAMVSACSSGYLEIAQWCASMGAANFGEALKYIPKDHTDVIEWLDTQILKKRKLK